MLGLYTTLKYSITYLFSKLSTLRTFAHKYKITVIYYMFLQYKYISHCSEEPRSTLTIIMSFSLLILDLVGFTMYFAVHLKSFEQIHLFHLFFSTIFFCCSQLKGFIKLQCVSSSWDLNTSLQIENIPKIVFWETWEIVNHY